MSDRRIARARRIGRWATVTLIVTLVSIGATVLALQLMGSSRADAPSEVSRAREVLRVLRMPQQARDRLPEGIGDKTSEGRPFEESRRVGPLNVAGRRFFVAYDRGADQLCVITPILRYPDAGQTASRSCDTTREITRPESFGQDRRVVAGLVPDGVRCVVVHRKSERPLTVLVVRNAYAVQVRTLTKSVTFKRDAACRKAVRRR